MILDIVQYGHPALRTKGAAVGPITDEIRALAGDLIDTMREANGVGLAAQQVGRPIQLAVVDITDADDRPSVMWMNGGEVDPAPYMPLVLIDPEVTLARQRYVDAEGCLSFPEIRADIRRSEMVRVTTRTLEDGRLEFDAAGFLARAIQHEFDHLQGILFIDRMNAAQRVSLGGKLKALRRESEKLYRMV